MQKRAQPLISTALAGHEGGGIEERHVRICNVIYRAQSLPVDSDIARRGCVVRARGRTGRGEKRLVLRNL